MLALRTSAEDVADPRLRPAVAALGAATVPLAACVAAGLRRRAATRGDRARRAALDEVTRPELEERRRLEMADVRAQLDAAAGRWRRGEIPPHPSLTSMTDGALLQRPDPRELRAAWTVGGLLAAALVALIGIVLVAVDGAPGIVEVGAGTAVFGDLGIVLYQLMVQRALIRLSPTSLSVRHWYGRTRTIPRDAVARIVLVRVQHGSMRSNRVALLLFVDGAGRRLLGTDLAGFPVED